MKRNWLIGLIALVCLVSTAHAYKTNSSGGKTLRWADSSLPLAWYMNMNGYSGLSAAVAEGAFKHGMDQWSAPTCSKFRTDFKGTTTRKSVSDKTNVLLFGSLNAGSATTAITYTRWGSTSKTYTDADIVFRNTKPWSVNPTSSQLDIRGTATHEIGHMLGLGHSSVNAATMYSKTTSGASPRRFLEQDDINGVCHLYPATGNPPPECTTDTDCSSGQVCQAQKCVSKTDGRGTLCGSSAGGVNCLKGLLCVNKSNQPAYCVELCQNGGCPNGGKCLKTTSGSQFCACDADTDCLAGQTCKNRNCFSKQGTSCRADADCTAPLKCLEGKCQAPPAGCQSDTDCEAGKLCDVGKCVDASLKGFGEACTKDADCTSTVCAAIGSDTTTYCTKACTSGSSDCPTGYDCRAHAQRGDLCHVEKEKPGCTSDAECGAGFTCVAGRCAAQEPPEPRETPSEPSTPDTPAPQDTKGDAGVTPQPEKAPVEQPTTTDQSLCCESVNQPDQVTQPTSKGCACHAGHTEGSAFWLGMLLCLFLWVWRERRSKRGRQEP